MARKMSKETRAILALVDATPGFSWKPSRNDHILVDRDGQRVAVMSSTPSDWRHNKNAVADLRRAGLKIPH